MKLVRRISALIVMSMIFLILLGLTGCTLNSSEQPTVTLPVSSNSPQPPVENSPNTRPFSWILPDAELFGFEGTYGQLYDGIVSYLQVGQEKTRCAIPEVQIWGQDEQAGTYYCTISLLNGSTGRSAAVPVWWAVSRTVTPPSCWSVPGCAMWPAPNGAIRST